MRGLIIAVVVIVVIAVVVYTFYFPDVDARNRALNGSLEHSDRALAPWLTLTFAYTPGGGLPLLFTELSRIEVRKFRSLPNPAPIARPTPKAAGFLDSPLAPIVQPSPLCRTQ